VEIHYSVAVALCGPHLHDDRDSLQYHRVKEAVESMYTTLFSSHMLLICGDARQGQDVCRLGEYACRIIGQYDAIGEVSVPRRVVPLYDEGGSTLSDARVALRWINAITEPGTRTRLRLFTDWWHMERAMAMCRLEAEHLLTRGRSIVVTPHPLVDAEGRAVTEEQLCRERQGLRDYLAGTYASNSCLGWGKPPAAP
jgi:hypothetical protein